MRVKRREPIILADRVEQEFLPFARRPSRYIGGEINQIKKDLRNRALTVALCFPDTYEVGMSYTGLAVIYDVLNKIESVAAERVFAPWPDMEKRLRDKKERLCSLESSRALNEFNIIGFSLQYEMNYPDILNVLDLGGVALHRRERGESDPIVIAGGPCAFNPEPLADFIDAFVIKT